MGHRDDRAYRYRGVARDCDGTRPLTIRIVRRLLPMCGALAVAALILSFAPEHTLGPPLLTAGLGILALLWVACAPLDSDRDDALPAIAVVLSSVGILLIARLAPSLAARQEVWLGVAMVLAIALGPAFSNFRRFAAYKYLWVVASLALFGLLLLFGQEVNGARLWIRVGPAEFEPIEFIKLFVVFFMAAYLAEMSDVIAAARPWSLQANAKYLGPLVLGWGASMAILVVQRDLGMATLLLATFATLLYVGTRRWDIVAAGAGLFATVALWAARHFNYVHQRIAVWRNPFSDPLGAGYQSSQAYYAMATGGVFGTGYRLGHPTFIPDVATDYVYAAFSEEFGWIGAFVVLLLFLVLVRRIFAVGLQQPDLYAKLLAVGLAATLGFQVFVIVGGVIGIFPLTGITLPFVSYGGSSLVANVLLVSLAWSMSARPR